MEIPDSRLCVVLLPGSRERRSVRRLQCGNIYAFDANGSVATEVLLGRKREFFAGRVYASSGKDLL